MLRRYLLLSVISCASQSGAGGANTPATPAPPRVPDFVDVGVPILERDDQARIVRVRHEVLRSGISYLLEAEMPEGTGTIRVTSNGQLVAEGACRGGLRDGVWTQRSPLEERAATYVQGRLEGAQANIKPDEGVASALRKYIRGMSGEVRNGMRVGRWDFAVLGACTHFSYGSQCGNPYCDGFGPTAVYVTYDDNGRQTKVLRGATSEHTSDEVRPLFEGETFPVSAQVTQVPYTCELSKFTGLGIFESE